MGGEMKADLSVLGTLYDETATGKPELSKSPFPPYPEKPEGMTSRTEELADQHELGENSMSGMLKVKDEAHTEKHDLSARVAGGLGEASKAKAAEEELPAWYEPTSSSHLIFTPPLHTRLQVRVDAGQREGAAGETALS